MPYYTLTCKTTTHTAYVTLPKWRYVTINQQPTRCPYCAHTTSHREFDVADYIQTLFNYPRPVATALINHVDKLNQSRTAHNQLLPEDYIRMQQQKGQLPVAHTAYTAPVTLRCTHCHSVVQIQRTDPTTQATPAQYCVYCGHQSIVVQQLDTEEVAYSELAQVYQVTPDTIRFLYNRWSTTIVGYQYTYFADYIQKDPEVQQLMPMLRAQAQSAMEVVVIV